MNDASADPFARVESRVRRALADWVGPEHAAGLALPLERPKDPAHGHLGLGCFALAKAAGLTPPEAAAALARRLPVDSLIAACKPAGPFLNFRLAPAELARTVVTGILEEQPPFGPWPACGERVVIDYSSPNIAKPFHLGHLRSTVIGAALRRIYKFAGRTVFGINHLGDWGSQFGKIIVAWRLWGDEGALARNPMRHLFEIYVRYQREEADRPELKKEAAEAFRRLESGEDNEERRLWRKLRDVSLRAFQGPYERLGAEFEAVTGESFYEDRMAAVIRELVDRGIAVESEGALVVEFPGEGIPPCILRKSDGTTIYATRDLAALFYRREKYRFDRALYVVGSEQRLHFKQLKLVLQRLGWPQADRVEHVDFGLILFKNEETGRWEKGKTRTGNAIFLDEVLDEAVAGVRRIIEEKNPELEDKDAVAEQVGVSAVIFNDLKNSRIKDVKFDWDEMLSFDGETGPYVQYAGARLASILRKAGGVPEGVKDWSLLADAEDVLLTMAEFGRIVRRALERNEPSFVTQFTIRTAAAIHSYLKEHHVLSAKPPVRAARLALVAAARKLLATALGLIGVHSPDRM